MKAPVGLLSDGAVLRSKMEGLCPDKFRHDAQNADNARKNTAFPPVCKKCAKVCRAPENGKSHEESYDSSRDFGALEGTRIPGPLIKSQMLYRLSYERIRYRYNIQNIAVLYYHTRRKKASLRGKKLSFTKSAGAGTNFPFTNPARISTIKSCTLYADPGGRRRGEVHARPMQ